MNAIEALRRADPAAAGPARLGPAEEQLLQRIIATPTGAVDAPQRATTRRDRRPLLVTLVVAAAVVVLAVVAVRLGTHAPRVAATAGPSVPTVTTELREALTAVLPAAFDGRAALTWTDAGPGSTGDDMVDLTGKVPVYAATCEGGGAIAITVSGQPDRTLRCDRLTTLGPVVLDLGTKGGAGFAVRTTAGHPRYLVTLTAEAPVPSGTPAPSR